MKRNKLSILHIALKIYSDILEKNRLLKCFRLSRSKTILLLAPKGELAIFAHSPFLLQSLHISSHGVPSPHFFPADGKCYWGPTQ